MSARDLADRLAAEREQNSRKVRDRVLSGLRDEGYTIHPPGETCALPPAVPGARSTDPSTSAKAAELALPRAQSDAAAILAVYYEGGDYREGMTAREAVARAGTGSWRRVSDLIKLGLIEPVWTHGGDRDDAWIPLVRYSGGRPQRVHKITQAGAEYHLAVTRAQRLGGEEHQEEIRALRGRLGGEE